ncbi:MAG TPA: zinc-dependent metalloprotease [Chloroflexota bacterium]|nr:zinc-dependent metalloprotease [Chloroflexota bacterium]
MARRGRAFGTGLLIGAAAGALWGAAERYGRQAPRQLVDWPLVCHVAGRAAGAQPSLSAPERQARETYYRAVLERIEGPIAAYTRTHLPLQGTAVRVLDRREWIQANAANFQELLQPFERFYQERDQREGFGSLATAGMGRFVLSSQLGVLLGYLARRVLGQYDISLLAPEAPEPGKLYFVEPNIRVLEQRLALPPDEVRTWIALHEAIHAHEFELYPWVRRYLHDTLQAYLHAMVEELAQRRNGHAPLGGLVGRLVAGLRSGQNMLQALMTPEQRALVSRLQALMALLEGYSNHVMHQVGRQLLPHFALIEARVEQRRRQRSPAEQWFLRITGLNMKHEQYVLGEQFVCAVVEARGVEFLNRVWTGPTALPTEAELRAPHTWITRQEAPSATVNGGHT